MKTTIAVGMLTMAFLAILGLTSLMAAEETTTKVVGKVSTTEDDDGNLTAVKVTVEGGKVYNVVLDTMGKKLGVEMGGSKVEVTGTVTEKEEALWLKVVSFKEVNEGED